MKAQTELSDATSSLTKSYQRLSSGLRINAASDDAAGLAIASQLNAKSRVYTQAIRNVNDGLSVASIAEGALTALKGISQRQLELAEEAANGTYSSTQRGALNKEANALVEEYNRIVGSTTFNGRNLFDPSTGQISIQAGYGQSGTIQLGLNDRLARPVATSYNDAVTVQDNSYSHAAADFGDFNGDGKTDIISENGYTHEIDILFGNGDGTYSDPHPFGTTDSIGQSVQLEHGDIDGDGKQDVLVDTGKNETEVFLSNGDGTFKAKITVATHNGIRIGDFNGDGKADLVSFAYGLGQVGILFGNGNGTFKAAISTQLVNTNSVLAADFNGDGRTDIVSAANGTLYIALANSDGTFSAAFTFSQAPPNGSFAVGDFNGDGTLDFATGGVFGGLTVFSGNGNGTFKSPQILTTASDFWGITSGDFNGDGVTDIAAAIGDGSGDGYITIFQGNGDGTFAISGTHAETQSEFLLFSEDLNNTGVDTIEGAYFGGIDQFSPNVAQVATIPHLNLNSQSGARAALNTVNSNLNRIESQLGTIGATTSRLHTDLSNLQTENENFLAAASRITDVDVASETANLTREQILQQAGASVLAQANQQPALALKLLQ